MANHDKKTAVLLVPFPAQSHLNMFLNLSHVISSYNIPVHYVSSTQHIEQVKLRNPELISSSDTSSYDIKYHDFFLPPCDGLVDLPRTLPHLHKPVSGLIQDLSEKNGKLIVVYDGLMASVVEHVTTIQNSESYIFFTVSAFNMFVYMWRAIPEKPFVLDPSNGLPDSLPSVEASQLPSDFAAFVAQQFGLSAANETGRLYNSSRVIEGTYIGLVEKLRPTKKHFAVGPFITKNIVKGNLNAKAVSKQGHPHTRHRCLEWLDSQLQEKESVIFVSFGTTLTLPEKQIHELALGLEKSGQKFIWVLRNAEKGDNMGNSADEQGQDEKNKQQFLDGFLERVGNKGMVVRQEWVPQIEVLDHPSIGGFMTHCGWGSLTESMSMGVPVVAWPMHSDQPLNSVLVTEVLKVGVLVRDDYWQTRGEVTTSDMVANAVRKLMATDEGQAMRRRAKEIGLALQGSMAEGGSSRSDMDSFISHITRP